jgi:hypothetical protein
MTGEQRKDHFCASDQLSKSLKLLATGFEVFGVVPVMPLARADEVIKIGAPAAKLARSSR